MAKNTQLPAKSEKLPAKSEKQQLMVAPQGLSFEQDSGQGFELADKDSYALPFLRIIQSNSPQINPSKGEFIEGAQQGMFYNTVDNTLYPGDLGIRVVPVHYERSFAEFEIREKGGGFRGSKSTEDAARIATVYDEKGRAITPAGTQLVDTRYHYVLLLDAQGLIKPAIVCLASTQLKKSRRWMTMMDNIKFQREDGSFYTPPMFSHVYKLTTIPESNEKGSWYGLKLENDGVLTDPVVYATAKNLRQSIKAGQARAAAEPPLEREPGMDDDIPGFS